MHFKDHFSTHSDQYQRFRPDYPDDLFNWLATLTTAHNVAWDCATGNGQAAKQLAVHYDQVIATDASQQQISQAVQATNIHYGLAQETNPDIADNSIDLVTVAQAIHWFDASIFFTEVKRVLKPGGVLAVWGYNLLRIDPETDSLIDHLYSNTLKDYWPEERKLLEAGYSTIRFPFTMIDSPVFEMSRMWSRKELLGYLDTWSAVKRYTKDNGVNPLDEFARQLSGHWPEKQLKKIIWPLILVATRS
jgi:SAM-dependent methyltransferase